MGISKDRTADGQAARAQPKQLQTKVAGKVLIRSIRTFAGFGPAERVVTADQGVQIVLDPIEEIRVPTYLRTALKFGAATVFVLSSAMIALHAFNYLSVQFNPRNPFHVSYAEGGWAIPAHFYCAGLALLLAPMQISATLRRRWPALHRSIGWIYVATVTIGGLAGLQMAFHAQGGWSTGIAFLSLALLWLLTTITAVAMAIRRNIAGHRRWMLRSIALTFSGVTLRVILGAGMAAGFPFMTVYLVAAWSAWPLNLLVMESYLRLESARRLRPAGLMQPRDTGSASGPQIA